MASKRASQRRWWLKPENRAHFCDEEAVKRTQAWRKEHPGYWRKRESRPGTLRDSCSSQDAVAQEPAQQDVPTNPVRTLQDVCQHQTSLLIGLLAELHPTALQDDMAQYAWSGHAFGSE